MTFPHVGTAFGSHAFRKEWLRACLATFGFLWLFLDPFDTLVPDVLPKGWPMFFSLLLLALFYGTLKSWPKTHVTAKLPGANVEVIVKVGDIFSAKGNVIIGTNDVFDTHIGDDIISDRSLQAQFVNKRLDGSVTKLDAAMDAGLSAFHAIETDLTKTKGKIKRYEIGTTIPIDAHGSRYFLCAYCKMDKDCKADTNLCMLITSLDNCWNEIHAKGQNMGIAIPVIAAEFGRTGLTQTQLIQLIILSFVGANKTRSMAPTITIYVHKSNAEFVDFSALKLWLRGVLWS